MRLAEAVHYAFPRRPWTLCLALFFFATPFSQAQTSAPAEKDGVTDQAGLSSSKTTHVAHDEATGAVPEPSITSGAKRSGSAIEQSDARQLSNRSFFQDVVRHPPKTTTDKFHACLYLGSYWSY